MRWITLRQLKALRRLPVPPEALEAGRRRLLIVMADAPMAANGSRLRAFIWKPALAAFVVVVFVAVSGGSAVYAAQGALPGDALYPVKLASEGVQEHLVISPERRFAVQAEHAALRLEETQQLMERSGLDRQERKTRVRTAITGYERSLTSLGRMTAKMAAGPKRGRDLKTMQEAEQVLDRHAELVASATDADPDIATTVIEPIDDSIRFENDVFDFTRHEARDDGEKTDDATDTERQWEDHRKDRLQRSEHLRKLGDGLRLKPLEIKAGL